MIRCLLIALINILLAGSVYAATPVIYFTDVLDAVVSGFDGSSTLGATVTVWGRNLGTAGSGVYITACGDTIQSTSSTKIVEWAVVDTVESGEEPAEVYTSALGMERITFFMNTDMATGAGTIAVTTPEGTSNTLPLYARTTGNIYFITSTGNDTNNGSSTSAGWATLGQARRTLQAGDTVYIRSGTYTTGDQYAYSSDYLMDFWTGAGSDLHHNGAENNTITVKSYPGEEPNVGNASIHKFMFFHGGTEGELKYWNFSKMLMRNEEICIDFDVDETRSLRSEHLRFVGLDMSTVGTTELPAKTVVKFTGNKDGQEYVYFLGNNIHDAGTNTRGGTYYASGGGYPVYLEGYGWHKYIYIGYNEMHHNPEGRLQLYGHTKYDSADYIYIYNNWIHNQGRGGIVCGGGDDEEPNQDYDFMRHLYLYNNILSNNNGTAFTVGGVGRGAGGYVEMYNNTVYDTYELFHILPEVNSLIAKNNIFYSTNFFDLGQSESKASGENNIWYGDTHYPTWDTNQIKQNPNFTDIANDDYRTLSGPAVDGGVAVAMVTDDYLGVSRPQGSAYDLGAYEYDEGQAPPSNGGGTIGSGTGLVGVGTGSFQRRE